MEFSGNPDAPSPLIPAATVLLLRDNAAGALEVLLLRRNRALKAFGGAWVFPGGRVDDADGKGLDIVSRAKAAAIRETHEETNLDISGSPLVSLSTWIPPVEEKRRFSTQFFVAQAPDEPVKIDEGEIHDYQWITPQNALAKVPSPDLLMMPPTFISIYALKDFETTASALDGLSKTEDELFETKFTKGENGFVTLWPGDKAYDDLDLSAPGPRRRLYADPAGWKYERDY